MKVLKFGGSSVGNAENIEKVVEIVTSEIKKNSCAVVLSAMQGTTDALIETGKLAESGDESFRQKINEIEAKHFEAISTLFPTSAQKDLLDSVEKRIGELEKICEGVFLLHELSPRTLDRIVGYGEILLTNIIAAKFDSLGIENVWKDTRELIITDSNFGFATVNFEKTNSQIRDSFKNSSAKLHILPGFIAADINGATTTLGRGGSDYTAAILAAALDAEVLEIWTDVSGMMTADPRFVRNVREIRRISYREAMELSHFGAKVIYPPTIQPVMTKGIPVWVKNTFAPTDFGTLIEAETSPEKKIIRGISSIDKISVLNLEGSGMVGIPGFSKRLFDALSRANINVILITQSSSEHSICVAIEDKFGNLAKESVDKEFEYEISVGKIEPLRVENGFSILALVGDNMKEHTGVSGKMFATLGSQGINIHAIAQGSSERNISAIINSKDVRKAVNTLHEEFFSDGNKQVNVFIVGVGTVGKKLIEQIRLQNEFLRKNLRLNVRVVGLAKSRNKIFDEAGIKLSNAENLLENAPLMNMSEFTDLILEKNLRNSIFVDVTANAEVVEVYPKLLQKSVSIIACNKIAASSAYAKYQQLKDLSREFGTAFLFETNVGAGLPIINTLNDLIRSGDEIKRIEAVLSGTLNFVFNNYDGSRLFSSVVRQAQDEGYTEPDPRLDLSGTDVARKILILAREAGFKLEMPDIENKGFLPESCLQGSVEDFYSEMEKHESYFRDLFETARGENLSLKYIASFDNGKASVGLQSISKEHNFANLSGKDNAVLFYTNRYADLPLVVKGAGAGADVTAAGVFADIIRAARI
ncbi:MAG: bifunctional aspartate kinase/homoserine dehydrogenase I [Acidobacteria bacterium]|jgi:aspartokinase/homoserine dehydrogenase 1|nr:bifunctional aspartate kinase/homoserine dehydrogenase I [Acidobacteriota bacterium]